MKYHLLWSEYQQLLSATCDLFFHSSTLASTPPVKCREYRALCRSPTVGCSSTVFHTNRSAHSATSHFPLKNLRRRQARWPAQQRRARAEHAGQFSCPRSRSHWAIPAGCFTELQQEQVVTDCTCHSLLLILYSEPQYTEKRNPKKPGAPYVRQCYRNSSNKKMSKTPPDERQARSKARNGETKAAEATNISTFRLLRAIPSKGILLDEQGCKTQKRDTGWFCDSFQVAAYAIPALLSPRAIHLLPVMESHTPSRWAALTDLNA